MLTKDTENKDAGKYAFFAARDARMKSAVNATLFSADRKLKAERIKLGLEMCYASDGVFLEFRKTMASIKVNHPCVRDRKNLRALEADYESWGCTKRKSAQGITYRLPRV